MIYFVHKGYDLVGELSQLATSQNGGNSGLVALLGVTFLAIAFLVAGFVLRSKSKPPKK